MRIKNLHQPYVFKHNNLDKIVVSELGTKKLTFKFGSDTSIEEYWKLKILDENYNITTIKTPDKFIIDDNEYNVIQECNGFIDDDKISYVVGLHNYSDNFPMTYKLVLGYLDLNTFEVSDTTIIKTTRSAFVKNGNLFDFDKSSMSLNVNGDSISNYSSKINSFVRLIGVQNENKVIITGYESGNLRTFLHDLDTNEIKLLKTKSGVDVYKSSFLGNYTDGVFAYAEKINLGNSESEYYLNIDTGFILETI